MTYSNTNDSLEHFGVKGMKWGVRKDRTGGSDLGSTERSKSEKRKAAAKKAAIGVGALVAIGGAAYVGHKLKQNGNLKVSSLKRTKESSKVVEKVFSEPTKIMHVSRGKNKGFTFYKDGGIPNTMMEEYTSAFGDSGATIPGSFKRYGKSGEKIAATFLDPEGRVDRAGRVIPHDVIVPRSMTAGINNIDDVVGKIWPQIKDTYNYE